MKRSKKLVMMILGIGIAYYIILSIISGFLF